MKKTILSDFQLKYGRLPSLDELLSGKFASVNKVLEMNKRRRLDNAINNRGMTSTGTKKHVSEIPLAVYWHPETQQRIGGADGQERKRNIQKFLMKYPQLRVS